MVRVAAYQAQYRTFPQSGGAELVVPHVERASEAGVELLCCPEAMIGELANESDGDAPATVALSVADGELHDAIAPLFGFGMTIVIGFTERARDGVLHNSAAVIADRELAGISRKVRTGRSVCRPGAAPSIFHHGDLAFGVLICNDAYSVEPARDLAARGAQLFVVPVHGGHRPAKEATLRARGTDVLIERAVEHGVPLVAADVAGWQHERVSHGTTCIIDGRGEVLVHARELVEDLVITDIRW